MLSGALGIHAVILKGKSHDTDLTPSNVSFDELIILNTDGKSPTEKRLSQLHFPAWN